MKEQAEFLTWMDFLGKCDVKPRFHGFNQADDILPLERHRISVSVADPAACDLEREGFARIDGVERVGDINSATGRIAYLRQLELTVLAFTGASAAFALGNGVVRRSERAAEFRLGGTTVPGRFAHADFSSSYAGSGYWFDQTLTEEDRERYVGRRYAIYNLWQSISEPPQDSTLALCDAQSVDATDEVACDQILDDREPQLRIENTIFRFNARSRWVVFPNLELDQLLIFKGYDSDRSRVSSVAHGAIDCQGANDSVPRESIDERVLAVF